MTDDLMYVLLPRSSAVAMAHDMLAGAVCPICGEPIADVQVREAVFAGKRDDGRCWAHGDCWARAGGPQN